MALAVASGGWHGAPSPNSRAMITPLTLMTVYLALDIECTGENPWTSSVIAIGACLGRQDGTVLEQRFWYLQPLPGESMSTKTHTEFWDKNADVLKVIESGAKPGVGQVREFTEWLRALAGKYAELELVSDNPSFDLGRIDILIGRAGLGTEFGSIRYMGSNRYIKARDPSSELRAAKRIGTKERVELLLAQWRAHYRVPVHDHLPMNDATSIYYDQVFVEQFR